MTEKLVPNSGDWLLLLEYSRNDENKNETVRELLERLYGELEVESLKIKRRVMLDFMCYGVMPEMFVSTAVEIFRRLDEEPVL